MAAGLPHRGFPLAGPAVSRRTSPGPAWAVRSPTARSGHVLRL